MCPIELPLPTLYSLFVFVVDLVFNPIHLFYSLLVLFFPPSVRTTLNFLSD
jgi:hypothetical protein